MCVALPNLAWAICEEQEDGEHTDHVHINNRQKRKLK